MAAPHPSSLPVAADPSERLLESGEVVVGRFRCPPWRPDFRTAGEITQHCFALPRRGVWIQHEGEPAFVADTTCITLYNPAQRYERRALDPDGDHSDWINVSDAIAREVVAVYDRAAADDPERVFRHAHAPASPELYGAHRRLFDYVRRAPRPDALFVEERAIDLLDRIMAAAYPGGAGTRARESPLTNHHRDLVEYARAHLNLTFASGEGLGSLARAVGTSVFHLCRIFRRGTGLTIHAYRQRLRLRRAHEVLEDPRTDLLTLAIDLGYSGHSHFTAAFRREFGIVPSRLRSVSP